MLKITESMDKQMLIDIVVKANNLTQTINAIFYNLYEHKLYVYMNDIYFFANGCRVNPNDYKGVYNLYVYEIQYLIAIMEKTSYPFNEFEYLTIDFFNKLGKNGNRTTVN